MGRYTVLDYSNNTRDNYWATIVDNLDPDCPQEVNYEELHKFISSTISGISADKVEKLTLDVFEYLYLHPETNCDLDGVLQILTNKLPNTLIKPPCFNGEASTKETNEWLANVASKDSAAIAKANTTKDSSTAIWSITGSIESDFNYVVIKNNTTNEEMTGEELIQELQWKFMNQSLDASVDTAKAIVEHLKQNPSCKDSLTALMHNFKK